MRVDPETGEVSARVDLKGRTPKVLLPVGRDLWVIDALGNVLVVGSE